MNPLAAIGLYARLNRHFYHWDEADIRSWQWERLKELLTLVERKSPWYRERFRGIRLESLDELPRLPEMDKQAMMDNFDGLNTEDLRLRELLPWVLEKEMLKDWLGYYQGRFVVGLSSGTSGNKGVYVTPRRLTERLPSVFLARGGVDLKDLPLRILFLLRVFSQGFQDINAPLLKLHYRSTMTPPEDILAILSRERINVLMAPPSFLRLLAPLALAHPGRRRLRKVISYAEPLTREDQERFMAAFDAPVRQIYQASEGQIASPCRLGALHVNEDLVCLELLDQNDRPVTEPGQPAARMLVTNLVNKVQPLIRYRMNDLVSLGPPCACGSSFRVLDQVQGRDDEVFRFPDAEGRLRPVFPDLMSRWIITTSDYIRDFQAFLEPGNRLRLLVDAPEGQGIETALADRLARELSAYGITPPIQVNTGAIKLPEEKNKLRRFFDHTTGL